MGIFDKVTVTKQDMADAGRKLEAIKTQRAAENAAYFARLAAGTPGKHRA